MGRPDQKSIFFMHFLLVSFFSDATFLIWSKCIFVYFFILLTYSFITQILKNRRKKKAGPTEIWTRIAGFKVQSANHYTMGPNLLKHEFLRFLNSSSLLKYTCARICFQEINNVIKVALTIVYSFTNMYFYLEFP